MRYITSPQAWASEAEMATTSKSAVVPSLLMVFSSLRVTGFGCRVGVVYLVVTVIGGGDYGFGGDREKHWFRNALVGCLEVDRRNKFFGMWIWQTRVAVHLLTRRTKHDENLVGQPTHGRRRVMRRRTKHLTLSTDPQE